MKKMMKKMASSMPKAMTRLTGIAKARSVGGNAYAKGIAKRAAPKAAKAYRGMGRKK